MPEYEQQKCSRASRWQVGSEAIASKIFVYLPSASGLLVVLWVCRHFIRAIAGELLRHCLDATYHSHI